MSANAKTCPGFGSVQLFHIQARSRDNWNVVIDSSVGKYLS